MSKIAESLGIPPIPSAFEDAEKEVVHSETSIKITEENDDYSEVDTAYEERRIHEGDITIDTIIKDGRTAFLTIFDAAENMDPRYRSRMMEVAGSYLKTALEATINKQRISRDVRRDKKKEQINSIVPTSSTTIKNIFTDRETALKMLDESENDDET